MQSSFGSGVGAAGLVLARRVEGLRVTLVELDAALAALANENILRNALAEHVRAVCLDVTAGIAEFSAAGLTPGSADHVLMNPPFNAPQNASPDRARQLARSASPGMLVQWVDAAARIATAARNFNPDLACRRSRRRPRRADRQIRCDRNPAGSSQARRRCDSRTGERSKREQRAVGLAARIHTCRNRQQTQRASRSHVARWRSARFDETLKRCPRNLGRSRIQRTAAQGLGITPALNRLAPPPFASIQYEWECTKQQQTR